MYPGYYSGYCSTIYIVQCTLYIVHGALYNVHCSAVSHRFLVLQAVFSRLLILWQCFSVLSLQF